MQSAQNAVPWVISGLSLAIAGYSLYEAHRVRQIAARRTARRRARARAKPPAESAPEGLLAGVELGGTTCVVALAYAEAPTRIFDRMEIRTTNPHETVGQIVGWLEKRGPFVAIGIASFGPVDLNPESETYGYLTTTPKKLWEGFPLLKSFVHFNKDGLCPIGFDTDVNAPAIAELAHGQFSDSISSCAYITVGTGIGVGLVVNGAPVHGLMHPEGGHLMLKKREGDEYRGWTLLHPGSVEAMASAQACAERCGVGMEELATVDDDNAAWDDIAYYLAQLCVSILFLVSPEVIILSGGVMKRKSLFKKIRSHFEKLNDGYVQVPKVVDALDTYIVPSQFGNDVGIIGAVELARRAFIGFY